jgi:hypothetical protein
MARDRIKAPALTSTRDLSNPLAPHALFCPPPSTSNCQLITTQQYGGRVFSPPTLQRRVLPSGAASDLVVLAQLGQHGPMTCVLLFSHILLKV